jgi:hypothetical protein
MMFRLVLLLAWLTPLAVARIGNVYPLKERRTQDTEELTLDDFMNFDLTFSDDSPAKELERFYLDLLETDGNLPVNPSFAVVQFALEDFIQAELAAIYGKNNAIELITTTVLSQEAITRSGSSEIPMLGSRLETQVSVIFDNEPSPEVEEVEEVLKFVMQNMTYFVTNLTAWADPDGELSRVHTVSRVEIGTTIPTATEVEEGTETEVDDEGVNLGILIPIIAGGIVLFAVIALLATKRKQRVTVVAAAPPSRKSQPLDVEVYMDDDNSDNFSFETSLAESPVRFSGILKNQTYGVNSPLSSPTTSALHDSPKTRGCDERCADDNESGIFSNLDCGTSPSPRNGSSGRSVFSFFSAVTRGSDSTLGVSNTTNREKYTPSEIAAARIAAGAPVLGATDAMSPSNTPKSRASLFNFSEGDEEDASLHSGTAELYGIEEAPSDEERSNRSEEQETTTASIDPLLLLVSSDSTEFGPRQLASPASPSSVDFSHLLSDNENSGFVSAASQSPSIIQPTALEKVSSAQQDNSTMNQPESPTSAYPCAPPCSDEERVAQSHEEIMAGLHPCGGGAAGAEKEPQSREETMAGLHPCDGGGAEKGPQSHDEIMAGLHPCGGGGVEKAAISSEEIMAELAMATDTKVRVFPSAAGAESPRSLGSIRSSSVTPMMQNTKSSKTKYGGYESDPGTPNSLGSSPGMGNDIIHLEWADKSKHSQNAARAAEFVESIAPLSPDSSEAFDFRGRRHAKSNTADGTSKYQSEAMHPMDWSLTSYEGGSVSGSEISQTEAAGLAVDQIQGITGIAGSDKKVWTKGSGRAPMSPKSPVNPRSPRSPGNARALNDTSVHSTESAASANQELISDLVWLENKISNSNAPRPQQAEAEKPRQQSAPGLVQTDSLSFVSNASSYDSTINLGTPTSQAARRSGGMQAIVCRDCFAPPGKLKIVIHSTKDGPAVHTVKKGSSLEGHIFPGDLIISVDNVDTRSYTAEQVMKIMTTKTRFERKITVLHFEDDSSTI